MVQAGLVELSSGCCWSLSSASRNSRFCELRGSSLSLSLHFWLNPAPGICNGFVNVFKKFSKMFTGLSIFGPKLLILIFGFQDSSFCNGTSSSSDWSVQTDLSVISVGLLSSAYLMLDR